MRLFVILLLGPLVSFNKLCIIILLLSPSRRRSYSRRRSPLRRRLSGRGGSLGRRGSSAKESEAVKKLIERLEEVESQKLPAGWNFKARF